MKPFDERRRFQRTDCLCNVDLDDYENAYSGHVRNLGLGGACIEAVLDKTLKIGQELILTIPYECRQNFLIIKGKVAWHKKSGIGIEFLKKTIC
jgi:Tfp pilus assembly protein PilZ